MTVIMGILFIFSSFGYVYLFGKKTGMTFYFAPAFVISSAGLVLYFGGMAGLLKETACLVLAGGLFCFILVVWGIIRKKQSLMPSFATDLCGIILAFGVLIFTSLVMGFKLVHYDNFSHWAVIVKYLLSSDALPSPDTQIVVFLDYPPGTAVFIYYVCRFLGNSQGVMLAAQNIMIFSCFFCLFGIVKEKRRFLLYSFLGMGCSVLSYLNLTIRINNLLVDFLLPLLSLASIAFTYRYSDRPVLSSVYSFVLLGFTSTVKSTGIIFSAVAYIFYFTVIIKNNCLKGRRGTVKKFLLTVFTAFGTAVPYGIWRYRLKTRFSDYVSKFSLDASSVDSQYKPAGQELHSFITSDFIKASFDLGSRAAQVFFLCNILVIITLIVVKTVRKNKWNLGWVLLLSDIMVVLYYIGILYMYLYSMPEEEAVYLAGFDRYACSIMTLFAGILIAAAAANMEKSFSVSIDERGSYKAYSSPSSKRLYQYGVLLTLVLGVNFIYSEINGLLLIREEYPESLPGRVEAETGDLWIKGGKENKNKYLVTASDAQGQVSSGEVRYVCRYFLYAPDVDVVSMLSMDFLREAYKDYDFIFVLDSEAVDNDLEKTALDFLKNPGIYSKKEIEEALGIFET